MTASTATVALTSLARWFYAARLAGSPLRSVDILFKDASLLFGSARKTLPPHLLGGVHNRGAHYSSRRGPRMASRRFRHESLSQLFLAAHIRERRGDSVL
jgi:hypothetical protein